jgi:hypothetical protein
MKDDRDYKLDLSAQSGITPPGAQSVSPSSPTPRPYLSVHFACCNIYIRIYRAPDSDAYKGHCPKCNKPVTFKVGQGGSDARIFRVE